MELSKIIVVTPVKNEAWVIKTFLTITSCFADAILIADQQSGDDTLKIASAFEKVVLVKNDSADYLESERQALLIEKARELFPGNHIIVALDADEIASADSLNPVYWNKLKKQPPGTILYFKKTDLLQHGAMAVEVADTFYPLGIVDDGQQKHSGRQIHSVRIPMGNPNQQKHQVEDIFFLHLQWLRPKAQEAKRRFYQVKEKDFGTTPWYWRRKRYSKPGFMGWNIPLKPTPAPWVDYPESLGINLSTLEETAESWFDEAVYQTLMQKGGRRYWLDDIWDRDWNKFALAGDKPVEVQPVWLNFLLRLSDVAFNSLYYLKQKFSNR